MADGIDANRNKWQDLCLSCQQTRRASLSNPSADLGQSPESHENAETNQQPDSTETLKLIQDTKCSPDVTCKVNKGFCDEKPAPAGDTASAGNK